MSEQATVSILFADVCRSTQLFEQFGDVKARELIAYVLDNLRKVAERHGGKVIKTIGDEVMCTLPDATSGVLSAIEMQRRLAGDLKMIEHKIHIRVGLHHGDVLVEDADVFGDAVNVAARMAQLARAQQVVTTGSTMQQVSRSAELESRELGKTRVKGKLMPLDIVDVLWQEHLSNVTTVAHALQLDDQAARFACRLRLADRNFELKDVSPPFMMGRDPQNDLIIDDETVSRNHASIEFRKGYFILIDRSTNGTYVEMGDDRFRVHRDEVPLRRDGVISLGQPHKDRDAATLLHYECVTASAEAH